ncbi:MAG: flagellar basal body L-ring protein FlgH [Planctomycetota bacterium]|nr:flagellar basal body L-ring protein FlgH [Planctomycetota bacterium]
MNSISRSLLLLLPLVLVAPAAHGDEPLPLVLPGGDARSAGQGLAALSPLMRARIAADAGGVVRYSQLPEARDWAAEDLIQIVVVEQSTEKIDQRRQLDKEGLAQAEVAEFSSFDFGSFVFSPTTSSQLPGLEIGAEKEFQGQGRYQRKDEMSDRFTAKVVEVKPNGNLVVEARVVRNWSGDQTEITLTGVVNPKWITANDSVLSSQISDLKIDKKHTGPVEDTTQRGLIAEVLDFLFAF